MVTTVISCASDKKQAADTATASGSHAKMLDKNPLLFYALPSLLYNIANVVMFVTVGTISPGGHIHSLLIGHFYSCMHAFIQTLPKPLLALQAK